MPDIVAADAVKFSNDLIRPQADRLAQLYNLAAVIDNSWTANGGGQTSVDLLRNELAQWADLCTESYEEAGSLRDFWTAESSPIPNTSDDIIDGSATDSRQTITGAEANNIVNRCIEFQNWLETGQFDGLGLGAGAHRNTVYEGDFAEAAGQTTTISGNLINRMNELRTNYEASSNAVLNTVLAVAVNTTV